MSASVLARQLANSSRVSVLALGQIPTTIVVWLMVTSIMSLKAIWRLLKATFDAWNNDNATRLGAALAYYTVFAIAPLLVIVIFIASLVLDVNTVRSGLFEQVGGLVGKKGAEFIESALRASNPHGQGLVASGVAVVTLILTASGLFMELQSDLNTIWGVEAKSGLGIWGFIKNRLLSFAMVVTIGFLLLVSLVVSTAIAALGKYFSALIPGMDILWLIVNDAVSFGVVTVLFAMVFKILPDVKIAWRDVWIGAAITSALFTIGKFLLGLYLGRTSTVSAYGAAGSLVLLLLWVYYSAQILFFGAEFTRVYANRFGERLQPKSHAQWRVVQPPQPPPSTGKEQGHKPLDRKTVLVTMLRDQVDSLHSTQRHLTRARPEHRPAKKTHPIEQVK